MYTHILLSLLTLTILGCKQPQTDNIEARIDAAPTIEEPSPMLEALIEEPAPTPPESERTTEIVFCLDATGSMSGLIGTAKEKIWDIVSEMAESNEVDNLKLGMVFYRDRGDNFVTKRIKMTTDLDAVYADLLEINAGGGGDAPESVNQALNEAVNTMDWSTDEHTYKTIFVVGDCPPHMDYRNDVKYTVSCKQAAAKGIIINTIKLGTGCPSAIHHFQQMASCSMGEYLQLDQNATDYTVATPYDKEINEVTKSIDNSRLYYGTATEQRENNEKKQKSMEFYDKSSTSANSARALYKSSKAGAGSWMGSKEIVSDFKEGKLDLTELEDKQLPAELRDKSIEEKEQMLNTLLNERDDNLAKLKDLNQKRKEFLEEEKKKRAEDEISFSEEILDIMKTQSKK